ncbi:hypothetical protein B0H10DRAFT_1944348 [Mycena sp. CBHHK59/15]|nr:hypothetical protein B0H10DRAFT_1944348 [Mycena sp. CBHHK59/15]
MFLPSTFQNVLLDKMLSISLLSDLYSHTSTWRHREDHSAALYQVILTIKDDIMEDRRIAEASVLKAATKQKRLKKQKAAEMEDSTDEEKELSCHQNPLDLAIRAPLPPVPPASKQHSTLSQTCHKHGVHAHLK